VDLGRVRAVVINEGITLQRVVYYLAFVVEGRDSLLVAFQVKARGRERGEVWVDLIRDGMMGRHPFLREHAVRKLKKLSGGPSLPT